MVWTVVTASLLAVSGCHSASTASGPSASVGATPEPSSAANPSRSGGPGQPRMQVVTRGFDHPLNSTVPRAGQVLRSGQYFGAIKSIDIRSRTLTFDVEQWLSGAAANRAAVTAGEIQPGENVPNDFFVVNASHELRRLPIAHAVTVTVARCPGACAQYLGTLDGLADSFTHPRDFDLGSPYRGAQTIYWLTLQSGEVTRIDEQYTP
jgi:hypothetical protein